MKKRIVTTLLATTMAVSMFAGCAQSDTQSSSSSSEASSSGASSSTGEIDYNKKFDSPVTVTCMVWNYADTTASTDKWVQDCKDLYNIDIDIQNVPTENYPATLKTKIAANDMPDIVSVHQITKGYSCENMEVTDDTFADISDMPSIADYSEEVKNNVKFKDKLFYEPISMNALGVLYNKKVFEDNSLTIPDNIDDFVSLMDTIKSKDIYPLAGSFSEAWSSQIVSMIAFDNYVIGDTEIYKELYDASTNVSTKRWADVGDTMDKALNLVVDWVNAGYFTKDPMGTDATGACQMLATGKAAMFVTGNWEYSVAAQSCEDGTEIGFFPLPVNKKGEDLRVPTSSNSGMCVNAQSKNLEATKIALNHYLSLDIQKEVIADVGGVSTNTKYVSDDPFIKELADGINNNVNTPYGLFGGTDYMYPRSCTFEMPKELQSMCAGLEDSKAFCEKMDKAIAEVATIK